MDQNNKKKKIFHRHFATPGLNLYWIIIDYDIETLKHYNDYGED